MTTDPKREETKTRKVEPTPAPAEPKPDPAPTVEKPAAPDPPPKDPAPAPAPADPPPPPPVPAPTFESSADDAIPLEVLNQRICDFDLRIEGRPLEKVIERFLKELGKRGITRLVPRFYLTDEWGVPEGTVALGIPFYLADERLKRVQKIKGGVVEGTTAEEILRYLRHEMGHVVNYAYRLYVTEEWARLFGPMARPYIEVYRALPFSADFVRHLPGGYAQKHPDEDWAETFAVWMTPKINWREIYSDCPGALAKLDYCERTLAALKDKDPLVTDAQPDVEAKTIQVTVQEYYEEIQVGETTISRSLDGDLQAIFAHEVPAPPATPEEAAAPAPAPPRLGNAAMLLKRQADGLSNTVYRWTGVDPGLIRQLVGHLARRADEMKLTYPLSDRDAILLELGGFLTTLAMNYVYKGNFIAKG